MKRTRLFKVLAVGVLITTIFASCTEQFTSQDALTLQSNFDRDQVLLEDSLRRVAAEEDFERALILDSLLRAGGRINYAVTVISGANSGTRSGRGEIAAGATVTVTQHGVTTTGTTDAAGQVVFDDMRVGNAAVTVSATDHTSAAVIVDLTPVEATEGDATIDYSKITRNAATMVPLFPTQGTGTATIQGSVWGETDLTNQAQEGIDGYSVTAYINVDNMDSDYFSPSGSNNADAAGRIIQITYTDIAQTVTTDANGDYSLTVPASGEGLPISIGVSDFAADVTYYEIVDDGSGNATLATTTETHIFSPDNTTSTDIEQVPAAFVSIEAPTGAEEAGSGAAANAIVEDEGVLVALRIQDVGRGFTQEPTVEITGEGYGATGTVSLTPEGRIDNATLTAPGQDYDEFNTNVDLVFGGKDADVTPVFEFTLNDMMGQGYSLSDDVNYGSVTGASSINDILTNSGSGYTTQPADVSIVNDNGSGTGAVIDPIAQIFVDELTESSKGSGYTNTPLATFAGGTDFDDENPDPAYAGVVLDYGPVVSVTLDNTYGWGEGPFSNDKTDDPTVDVDDVNGNSYNVNTAADIDVTWASTGVLPEGTTLQINNGGSGYIDGEVDLTFSGAGASTETVVYKVRTNGDAITEIEILNTTDGWDQDQTITIATSGAGTGADVQLAPNTIEYRVASVTFNTGGSYQFNTLTQDEIDEFQDGSNPYGGGILDNDMRLYVNSSTDDFLYTSDLSFNRCVASVSLINSGEYLEGPTSLTIDAPAGAGGSQAVYTFELDGFIQDLVITAGGAGYTYSEDGSLSVDMSGTSSDDDDAEIDLSPFESNLNSWEQIMIDPLLTGFTVEDGGDGFLAAPNVNVTVPGSAGESYGIASATVSGGAVTAVTLNGGTSIEYNFSDLGNLDFSGVSVDLDIWKENGTLVAVFATGSVVAVNVTNGGQGYDAADPPTVRFVTGGGDTGDGAEGTAIVVDGRVVRVTVDAGGSGYDPTSPPSVEFIEPDDTPVTGKAVAIIDDKGVITSVSLRSATDDNCFDPSYYSSSYSSTSTTGEGYEAVPAATVTPSVAGVGSGAVLEVSINDEGEVSGIEVIDGGSGYVGGNWSVNYTNTPGNDVDVSYYTVTNQSNDNVVSGKTHIRNIQIGTGRTPDGN
ncbi:MAG TPA: hypothetical protein DCE41_07485 [Cytophagales bacterium]|nr:hypothetical protein [Cytophagales bacterium]HAA23030.1 hypothetical protein [Cytophagales bacterium]HAP62075.1 hypothetical protein [Cytophagales bacterium]